MQNYFALAAPQISNSTIDTSPIDNALGDYRFRQRQMQMDALAAEQRQYERGRNAQQDALAADQRQYERTNALKERLAKQAFAADQLTNPIQRQAALESILREHPNAANLPAAYKDPSTAFKLIAGDYGLYKDELDRRYKESEINKNLAMSGNYESEARTRQAERDMINSFINGSRNNTTSSIPQNGQVIPQSYTQPQNTDPNVIKVVDNNSPNKTPVQPEEPTIMTQYGPMTKEKARSMTLLPNQGLQNFGKSLLEDFNSQNFQKSTQGEFEKRILDTTEHLSNLRAIQNKYNPQFLTWKEQGKQFWTSLKEKGGFALSPQEKQRRTEYIQFGRNVIKNVNDMIKAQTGAAMGKEEAERLMMSEANLNDDPTAFEAKWNETTTQLRLALYRYNYLRNQQHFTGTGEDMASRMSLGTMENILDRRSEQLETQLKQQFPQMPKQEMNNLILKKIDEEFGGSNA